MSSPSETSSHDALPTIWGLLGRRPWQLLAATAMIGAGVAALPCCGIGAFVVAIGSAVLLEQLTLAAGGAPPRTRFTAGVIAFGLAMLLGLAATLGVSVADGDFWTSVGTYTLAGALMGAALAPIAFTPFATIQSKLSVREGLVRAIDLAGGDRLSRLAPLCAAIAVALLVPVPVVAMGLGQLVLQSSPAIVVAGAVAFVVWMAAVPISGAALTLRYLRLERRNDAPTQLAGASTPLFGATSIGLLALAFALGAALLSPHYFQVVSSEGARLESYGVTARASRTRVTIRSAQGERTLDLPRDALVDRVLGTEWPECSASEGADGGQIVQCDRGERRVEARLDAAGAPIPLGPGARIRQAMTSTASAALFLALLSLAIALFRLGRLGVSLRLLFRPPFTLEGTVSSSEDGGPLRFEATDGSHRVHVPDDRVSSPEPDRVYPSAATLVSNCAIASMTFREAYAPCPPDALLVLGSREAALGRHLARARRVGFRLALITLASLVTASVAILLEI